MERQEMEITRPDRPETEIHGPERLEPNPGPERPETPPPPTFIIDGIAIPADDVELIFDNDIIAGYANENATIANTEDQEALVITNAGAGDQAPPSRSISSQIRDRKYLTQNYARDSLIAAGGYSLGSDSKYPGNPITV
jgi:hypothetical protein